MKQKLLIVFSILGFGTASGQQISSDLISSAGNYDSNEQIQLTWSIGETFTETISSSENLLTQGFQQSNLNISSVGEYIIHGLEIRIFPNPTQDIVNIYIQNNENNKLNYLVTDINGKTLINAPIGKNESIKQIDFTNIIPGVYIITFTSKKQKQSFQIIKN